MTHFVSLGLGLASIKANALGRGQDLGCRGEGKAKTKALSDCP